MSKTDEINRLLGVDESYKAPTALMTTLYDKDNRERLFRDMLCLFNHDVGYDWFHEYFQDDHADRKVKKQDFTPYSVGRLLTELIEGSEGDFYEPCAGTGGILIQKWNRDRYKHSPFDYVPSMYFYVAEELSDRSLPFLLFNAMVRGMNAVVIQCDVLSRKSKGAFFVQNDNDDHMQFSNLYRVPYSEDAADFLNVTWSEEAYEEADKPGELPKHIFGDITLEHLLK